MDGPSRIRIVTTTQCPSVPASPPPPIRSPGDVLRGSFAMDERQLTLLKRKLEALNYTQPLENTSAPLVQALVEDLVHTTESYRALKLQTSRQGQEINQFNNQARRSAWNPQAGGVRFVVDCERVTVALEALPRIGHGMWALGCLFGLCTAMSESSAHTDFPARNNLVALLLHLSCRHSSRSMRQVEVLKKDAGRLVAENNQLHVELIRDAERMQQYEKERYQEVKQLESQIAELSYWRNQTVEKFRCLEAENHGLKCRIEELMGAAQGGDRQ